MGIDVTEQRMFSVALGDVQWWRGHGGGVRVPGDDRK